MVTRSRARTDVIMAGLAVVTTGAVLVLPSSAYLAPSLWPVAVGLAGIWAVVRCVVLDRTLAQWRAWRVNLAWSLPPDALERFHA